MKETKRIGVFFNGGENTICDYKNAKHSVANIYKLYVASGHEVLCHELLKQDLIPESDKDIVSLMLKEVQEIIELFSHAKIKVDVYSLSDGLDDSLDFIQRMNTSYSQTEYSNILGYIRTSD